MGFSTASVAAWERGSREPGLEALHRLAAALRVGVESFFPGVPEVSDVPPADRLTAVEQAMKRLRREHYDLVDRLTEDGLLPQESVKT